MRGIASLFILTAAVLAVFGMAWGIQMSASGDHGLGPAHAHLNLLGWVTMALFGIYYHLVPASARTVLAKLHYGVALAGVVLMAVGIVSAIRMTGEGMAKAGSALTMVAMLIFLFTVIRDARRGGAAT